MIKYSKKIFKKLTKAPKRIIWAHYCVGGHVIVIQPIVLLWFPWWL